MVLVGSRRFLKNSQWFSVVLFVGSRRFSMVLVGSQWLLVVLVASQWFSVLLTDSCGFSVVLVGSLDSQWFS